MTMKCGFPGLLIFEQILVIHPSFILCLFIYQLKSCVAGFDSNSTDLFSSVNLLSFDPLQLMCVANSDSML